MWDCQFTGGPDPAHNASTQFFFVPARPQGHACTSDRKPTNPKLGWKGLERKALKKNLGRCGDWTHDPHHYGWCCSTTELNSHILGSKVWKLWEPIYTGGNKTGEKKTVDPERFELSASRMRNGRSSTELRAPQLWCFFKNNKLWAEIGF